MIDYKLKGEMIDSKYKRADQAPLPPARGGCIRRPKSRRDGILLTAGFSLRKVNAYASPRGLQVPQGLAVRGGWGRSVRRFNPQGLCTFIHRFLSGIQRLKQRFNRLQTDNYELDIYYITTRTIYG